MSLLVALINLTSVILIATAIVDRGFAFQLGIVLVFNAVCFLANGYYALNEIEGE